MKKSLLLLFLALHSFTAVGSELVLNYGVVSSKAKKRINDSTPISDYLAKNLSKYGYSESKVNVYETVDDMISALQQGKVDIITSTIYSGLLYQEHAQSSPIAIRWKKGKATYNSVFVTKSNGNIQNFEDLKGKVIGLESRESTSGYFLPIITLLDNGYTLELLTSPKQKPNKNNIGFVIFGEILNESNEINMSMWAARGVIDAIAYSSSNWDSPKDAPKNIKKRLSIFAKTEDYPRSIISVSHHISAEMTADIQHLLFNLDNTNEGQLLLDNYQQTKKFTPIDSASQELMDKAETQLGQLDLVL